MKKTLIASLGIILITLAIPKISEAQMPRQTFDIKYISKEFVYIGAGTEGGLAVGDSLAVERKGSEIARLVIEYCSEQSSSCRIVAQTEAVAVADKAVVKFKAAPISPSQAEKPKAVDTVSFQASQPAPIKAKEKFATFSGRLSSQIYHYDDRNPAALDLTQPTFRLYLNALKIMGSPISLSLKIRTRQNIRSRDYNSNVGEKQWRTMLYESAIIFDTPSIPLSARIGRIIPEKVSGVGYIDGFFAQYRLIPMLKIGAFAGSQPNWLTNDFHPRMNKFGGSMTFSSGKQGDKFESSAAMVYEKYESVVSRQMLYLQNNFSHGGRLNVYQSAVIDINNGWRKEKAGKSFSLSNFYATIRYRISSRLESRITYDNRQNYWTYDIQDLDQQLFDDNMRMGLRAELVVKAPADLTITPSFGYRNIKGLDESTYSYGLSIRKTRLGSWNLGTSASYSGFNSKISDGHNLSLSVTRSFSRGHNLSFGYGLYAYKYGGVSENRISQNLRAGGYLLISKIIYLSTNYQMNFGDDLKGQSVLGEIGYRF